MQPEDEHARIKERDRGQLAEQIFKNPLWDEGYTRLIDDLIRRLLDEQTSDEETLECKRRILALYRVKRELTSVMQTGQMAAQQLAEAQDGRTDRDRTRRTARA